MPGRKAMARGRLIPLAVAVTATLIMTACGSSSSAGTSSSTSTSETTSTSSSTASSADSAATGSGSSGSGSSGSDSSSSGDSGQTSISVPSGDTVKVTLITKDSINPFFIAMQKGAKAEAAKVNVDLTIGSGTKDGDEDSQIKLIENAVTNGDKGILITPSGPGVLPAIKKAREAGLYVIALDTPPDPADAVDITFATDNFTAGKLIGEWAAAQMKGKDVTIALLDQFNDKVVQTDLNRDQGFLVGMGIISSPATKNGTQPSSGNYSGGKYTIACQEATGGAQDAGKSAMETCLNKNSDINLVYTINEPAAAGAAAAMKAAGNTATIVSIDGGCSPGLTDVKAGIIGATSQQYPLRMAVDGVDAIATIARGGAKPAVTPGLSFFNTGVTLVTDKPVSGLDSITSDAGGKICWGS